MKGSIYLIERKGDILKIKENEYQIRYIKFYSLSRITIKLISKFLVCLKIVEILDIKRTHKHSHTYA